MSCCDGAEIPLYPPVPPWSKLTSSATFMLSGYTAEEQEDAPARTDQLHEGLDGYEAQRRELCSPCAAPDFFIVVGASEPTRRSGRDTVDGLPNISWRQSRFLLNS